MIKNNEINNREFAPLKFSYSKLPEDWHDRIFGKKEISSKEMLELRDEIAKQYPEFIEIAPSR